MIADATTGHTRRRPGKPSTTRKEKCEMTMERMRELVAEEILIDWFKRMQQWRRDGKCWRTGYNLLEEAGSRVKPSGQGWRQGIGWGFLLTRQG